MPAATTGFDWKKLVGALAPTIGTALGGPLVGMAIKTIGGAILGNPDASEDDVATAIQSGQLTGEQIAALKAADNDFKVKMKGLDIDILKLNQQTELAYVADTSDARHTFGANENVFSLGVCIIVGFVIILGCVVAGSFGLMTGYFHFDPNVATFASGLIGTVVGYLSACANQVVSYFFGSSKGSKDNGERIGAALEKSLNQTAAATASAADVAATAAAAAATK